jgi:hypothetical protein
MPTTAAQPLSKELQKRQQQDKELGWLKGQLSSLMLHGFYGKVTLSFEEGHLRRVVKEESLKPPQEPS